MHPDFFRSAAILTAHAHTASATSTHPPLIVMAVGSVIAGAIITFIGGALRRVVG
jgi:uncharacterized integral membrane protein